MASVLFIWAILMIVPSSNQILYLRRLFLDRDDIKLRTIYNLMPYLQQSTVKTISCRYQKAPFEGSPVSACIQVWFKHVMIVLMIVVMIEEVDDDKLSSLKRADLVEPFHHKCAVCRFMTRMDYWSTWLRSHAKKTTVWKYDGTMRFLVWLKLLNLPALVQFDSVRAGCNH